MKIFENYLGSSLLKSIKTDAWMSKEMEGDNYYLSLVQSFFSHLDFFIRLFVCKLKGHDWEDTSHADPDSGYISMDCRRCGQGFCHYLY